MTPPNDPGLSKIDLTKLVAFTGAHSATRRLIQVALVQFAGLLLLSLAGSLSQHLPGRAPNLDALVRDGDVGLLGAALLISLTGTLACALLTWSRQRTMHI